MAELTTEKIQTGRYRHFKGGEYMVIDQAVHSETGERYVVYRALSGEQGLWVRPSAMFFETVLVAGRQMPRFEFIGVSMDEDNRSS